MTESVTASYNDRMTIRNVEDDLRSTGIPSEKIRIDKERFKVRVMIPDATKAEVLEILKRHDPTEVH